MKTKRKKKKRQEPRPFNSTLPVWIVEKGEIKGTVIAECPRCSGRVILSLKRWRDGEGRGFLGRSCPYCFFTNRLPVKFMNKNLLEQMDRDSEEGEDNE